MNMTKLEIIQGCNIYYDATNLPKSECQLAFNVN